MKIDPVQTKSFYGCLFYFATLERFFFLDFMKYLKIGYLL